jgi:hypothetical protein
MPSKYTRKQIVTARNFWSGLTLQELFYYWKHYTTGAGRGRYGSVSPTDSFGDYLVNSATESAFCQAHDI